MAEAGDIALVTATLRARSGFKAGVVAEALHELGCICKREPPMNEGRVHSAPVTDRQLR